jgi:DNA-binding winged helix-turn-helix (wHTH) protein/tetratricopeptide (TPR) repeat protein
MAQNEATADTIRLSREPAFKLGALMVYPATRQILHHGCSETLEPRIMQVLIALAQSEGEIVGHDELIERCWDGRIVGENAIHRTVSKLRDLGLKFGGGAFAIETVTKVGYRLRVRWDGLKVIPEHQAATGSELLPRHSRRGVLGAGAAGLVAATGVIGYTFLRTDPIDERVAELIARSDQAIRDAMPDSEAQGVGFLEEAVALRPESSLAWGRLALARGIVAEHASREDTAGAVAGTQDAARRALSLDPSQADASAALALLPPYYGDWLAAEQRMDGVLALDPQHLPTRDALAFMHVAVGRAREGATDRLLMAAKEPLHAGHQFKLIYSHWILGDMGAADRAAERALQLWPKHPGVWFARLWTLAFSGRASRALTHIDNAREDLLPQMSDMLTASMTALDSRRPADIESAVKLVLDLVTEGPSNSISAVLILNGLGEVDRAFDVAFAYLLERGPLLASVRWEVGQISINDQRRRKTNMLFLPVAAGMRTDPRFMSLTADIGMVDYWKRAGITPDFLR